MKKLIGSLILLLLVFITLIYISLASPAREFSNCVVLEPMVVDDKEYRQYDSVLVQASLLYKANAIKRLMQGSHYREAWQTAVKVPIVYLDSLKGGMRIIEEGGGKQTHSLELEDPEGIRYSLRSITKDPKALVPEYARTLGLQNIVIDGISAQHPYAAIAAAQLAETAGLLHTHPKAVFVPVQDLLGAFNRKYGNRLFLLEYETEGDVNWTADSTVTEILDTEDLQELKLEKGDLLSLDISMLVRARLFDLLIGDWDRHAKQWGWAIKKNGDTLTAIPLAGDRDNAFFKLDGIIPSLLSHRRIRPELRSFEDDIDYLPGLLMPFDRYFLKGVPLAIFVNEAEFLQKKLTDQAIEQAVRSWPAGIYDIDGPEIIRKIRSRRDKLVDYARDFHALIQEAAVIEKPLKGSEDSDAKELMPCFDCL